VHPSDCKVEEGGLEQMPDLRGLAGT